MVRRRDLLARPARAVFALAIVGVLGAATLAACNTSAVHFATGAAANSAARSAGPSTEPETIGVDATKVVDAALVSELTAYVAKRGNHAAVAVLDRATGATVSVNADRVFQTASIVKVDILATCLLQRQSDGSSLTAAQKVLAHDMITESDNDAASDLFELDGGEPGLTAANKVFGLTVTEVEDAWGLTHTTAADQLRLLSAVMDPHGPIRDDDRGYILSLMSQVNPAQRWGVPQAAAATATGVYNKNGWDTMTAYGGLWGDNSIGRIVEPGHDWLVAVLSNYNRTDAAGHALVGRIATLAVGGLRLKAQLAATK